MKKILFWDEDKQAFVLEDFDDCVNGVKDFTLDYYTENISWASNRFDSTFLPEAKLQVFIDVIDNRLKVIRNALDDLELIKVKIMIMQKEISTKDTKDEGPF